ncbi:hypothetical protein RAS_06360 [Rickettsia asiatica]|uniref:Aldehyde dehydrogenase domain-containing protein n=1 Tax=Rickettsia asiatica TaxID=238800 RepID=A0A510GGU2_9RICK|nr:hypothetical protein RAS_06360 [Rickettsia asiatica]
MELGNNAPFIITADNRHLPKPAYREEFKGDTECRTAAYKEVREDASTGSTYKLPLKAKFGKMSNDLEKVANDLVIAKTRNSGQSCTSPNRIFIEESIYEYEKFIAILKTKFTKLKAGDGFDKTSDTGPLINHAAIEKIQKLLVDA